MQEIGKRKNGANGLKTVGILVKPEKPRALIILCHGYHSSMAKNNSTNSILAAALQKAGIASFRFDFFAHGESEGKIEELTVGKGVQNILDAVKLMQSNGFSRIGLIGNSFGGLCSVLAAPRIKNLVALGLKAPLLDIRENEKQPFFRGFSKGDAYHALQKIRCPVLIVHGDADERVPMEQSKKAIEVNPFCRLVVLHGADHKFSKPEDQKQFNKMMSYFLVQHPTTD